MSRLEVGEEAVHRNPLIGTRGEGFRMRIFNEDGTPKYGFVEKCPHCAMTKIARFHPTQVTCGGLSCRDRQNTAARKKRESRGLAR